MKRYPYTDSTDMVIYTKKEKKKKSRPFATALIAAITSSAITAGAFSVGFIFYDNSKNDKLPLLDTTQNAQTVTTNENKDEATASTLASKKDRKVMTIPQIAEKVGPSVVGVINKAQVQGQRVFDPFTGRYYYYGNPEEGEVVEQGSGSGIIISEDGYIVTNQHVIDKASEISIILNTGEEINAKLVGADTKTDLAVLKVDTDIDLTVATLGDSSILEVGELAVAIGNPMGMEFSGSVTAGIISAVNRTMTIEDRTYNLIQTDAAINNGNSGGALINQYGEVIGINSVKLSTTGVEGMGFAIAISEAKPIINDLMEAGYVKGRPLVGISIQETQYGMFIADVSEGSGAEDAGLAVGDIIVAVDGKKVKTTAEINEIRDTKKPGDYMKFKVVHEGETKEVDVKLTESK